MMGRECSALEVSLSKLSLDIDLYLDIIFPTRSRRKSERLQLLTLPRVPSELLSSMTQPSNLQRMIWQPEMPAIADE